MSQPPAASITGDSMSPALHHALMVATMLLVCAGGGAYLGWKLNMVVRNIATIGPTPILFLATEVSIYLSTLVLFLEVSRPARERPAKLMLSAGPFPVVSILVCCCNEDLEVIQGAYTPMYDETLCRVRGSVSTSNHTIILLDSFQASLRLAWACRAWRRQALPESNGSGCAADTVRAAASQKYPTSYFTVWVCDDGCDDKLKDWVEVEGAETGGRVRYLRRSKPKGVPHHFKVMSSLSAGCSSTLAYAGCAKQLPLSAAGNINWGLRHAFGDFVAILDADMIPSRFFLASMLPHFDSDNVAFVQSPQAFYNIVRGDPLNDASQDFYDVILPYRDGRNSAQCVGTGMVIRSSCLRQIQGFTTGSITEDFDTALTLHSQGYNSVYITQRLQAGLAAWTLQGYIKQHQRWATGSLQILFKHNPLFRRGHHFSLYRRIIYWYAGLHYFQNVVVLLMMTLPIFILAFDLRIMAGGYKTAKVYIILLVPYVVASRIMCYIFFCRLPKSINVQIRGEQCWYWMAPYNCWAIARVFFPWFTSRFEATGSTKKKAITWTDNFGVVWFHVVYCIAGGVVIAYKMATLDYHDCGALLKVTSWVPFLLFGMQNMFVPVLHVIMERWHPRPSSRRAMLNFDEYGVPILAPQQLVPPPDWRVPLYTVVPIVWFLVCAFYFFAAVSGYEPPFCTRGGLFSYHRL
eukprot:SM000090S24286  [mRNA]  locus=s90:83829:87604:- [translate_table: standard]